MIDPSQIREHMEVIGSCGTRVGAVDQVEGISIRLRKTDPATRGETRYIPLDWVCSVDQAVHLRKPCQDVQEEWQAHPVQEGEYLPEQK